MNAGQKLRELFFPISLVCRRALKATTRYGRLNLKVLLQARMIGNAPSLPEVLACGALVASGPQGALVFRSPGTGRGLAYGVVPSRL